MIADNFKFPKGFEVKDLPAHFNPMQSSGATVEEVDSSDLD